MTKLLGALADKLGVSAEYLWRVLVEGMVLSGVLRIIGGVLLLAAIVAGFIGCRKWVKNPGCEYDVETMLIIGGCFGAFGLAMSVLLLYNGILRVFAPEYSALQVLLRAVQ
jgi:hypothetical protein